MIGNGLPRTGRRDWPRRPPRRLASSRRHGRRGRGARRRRRRKRKGLAREAEGGAGRRAPRWPPSRMRRGGLRESFRSRDGWRSQPDRGLDDDLCEEEKQIGHVWATSRSNRKEKRRGREKTLLTSSMVSSARDEGADPEATRRIWPPPDLLLLNGWR